MRPVVNGLAIKYQDNLEFQLYNIVSPTGKAWARQYGVRGHPAILLLNQRGFEVWRYIGVVTAEIIETQIISVIE